jgi:hypothetical protein
MLCVKLEISQGYTTTHGQPTIKIRKTNLSLQSTTGHARTKVLRVKLHGLFCLELSPVRGPTSAPRVANEWTRGASGKPKY